MSALTPAILFESEASEELTLCWLRRSIDRWVVSHQFLHHCSQIPPGGFDEHIYIFGLGDCRKRQQDDFGLDNL